MMFCIVSHTACGGFEQRPFIDAIEKIKKKGSDRGLINNRFFAVPYFSSSYMLVNNSIYYAIAVLSVLNGYIQPSHGSK